MEQPTASQTTAVCPRPQVSCYLDAPVLVSEPAPNPQQTEERASPSLIHLAQQGDREAFCELCELHQGRLLRQALVLCGDPVVAEELAQDTLVAAWRGLRRFNVECRFFTWLCAILIHQHKTRIRAKARWARWQGAPDPVERLIDQADTPAEALASAERAGLLRRCLEQLPDKHREVVFLRFYAQESLEGIAKVLGCSVGTVKSRLFNALEKLRGMKSLTGPDHPDVVHL